MRRSAGRSRGRARSSWRCAARRARLCASRACAAHERGQALAQRRARRFDGGARRVCSRRPTSRRGSRRSARATTRRRDPSFEESRLLAREAGEARTEAMALQQIGWLDRDDRRELRGSTTPNGRGSWPARRSRSLRASATSSSNPAHSTSSPRSPPRRATTPLRTSLYAESLTPCDASSATSVADREFGAHARLRRAGPAGTRRACSRPARGGARPRPRAWATPGACRSP